MNEKFYMLPEEKQQKIINAGFLVFSQNSYKKSPMMEIANCAGISKSLLFHYFQNKKELYLFLWDKACVVTLDYLTEYGCYEPDELFEMMERGMKAQKALSRINIDEFVDGIDLKMMYREMYLASEGYLWEVFQWDSELDAPKLEQDFEEMLKFWKKIYLKKGE